MKPGTERIRTPESEVRDVVGYDVVNGAGVPRRRPGLEKAVDIRRRICSRRRTMGPRNRSG